MSGRWQPGTSIQGDLCTALSYTALHHHALYNSASPCTVVQYMHCTIGHALVQYLYSAVTRCVVFVQSCSAPGGGQGHLLRAQARGAAILQPWERPQAATGATLLQLLLQLCFSFLVQHY